MSKSFQSEIWILRWPFSETNDHTKYLLILFRHNDIVFQVLNVLIKRICLQLYEGRWHSDLCLIYGCTMYFQRISTISVVGRWWYRRQVFNCLTKKLFPSLYSTSVLFQVSHCFDSDFKPLDEYLVLWFVAADGFHKTHGSGRWWTISYDLTCRSRWNRWKNLAEVGDRICQKSME